MRIHEVGALIVAVIRNARDHTSWFGIIGKTRCIVSIMDSRTLGLTLSVRMYLYTRTKHRHSIEFEEETMDIEHRHGDLEIMIPLVWTL